MNCPDAALCERLGWHCHGRVYELYISREDYRRKIDQQAADRLTPSLFIKVLNYGKSLVKRLASGFAKVPDEVYVDRLTLCSECEKLNTAGECSLCGCPVDLKASWRSESCPIGKWLALTVIKKAGGCGCNPTA